MRRLLLNHILYWSRKPILVKESPEWSLSDHGNFALRERDDILDQYHFYGVHVQNDSFHQYSNHYNVTYRCNNDVSGTLQRLVYNDIQNAD